MIVYILHAQTHCWSQAKNYVSLTYFLDQNHSPKTSGREFSTSWASPLMGCLLLLYSLVL